MGIRGGDRLPDCELPQSIPEVGDENAERLSRLYLGYDVTGQAEISPVKLPIRLNHEEPGGTGRDLGPVLFSRRERCRLMDLDAFDLRAFFLVGASSSEVITSECCECAWRVVVSAIYSRRPNQGFFTWAY